MHKIIPNTRAPIAALVKASIGSTAGVNIAKK